MRKYCKAYHLRDMRQFRGWVEQQTVGAQGFSDEAIVYLWDDFSVVTSPILRETVLFADSSPEWQDFCTTVLRFHIPDDVRGSLARP